MNGTGSVHPLRDEFIRSVKSNPMDFAALRRTTREKSFVNGAVAEDWRDGPIRMPARAAGKCGTELFANHYLRLLEFFSLCSLLQIQNKPKSNGLLSCAHHHHGRGYHGNCIVKMVERQLLFSKYKPHSTKSNHVPIAWKVKMNRRVQKEMGRVQARVVEVAAIVRPI